MQQTFLVKTDLRGEGGGGGASYEAIIAWNGVSVPIPANIPAGVTVTYQGTVYIGTLVASEATKKYVYLIKAGEFPDTYDEYRTYRDQNGNWFWEKGGSSCHIDLTEYLKYTQQTLTDSQKTQARTNIGAIALADVPVEIYTATYDVEDPTHSTSYVDVAAAYTAGKHIQVKAGFDYFPLKSVEFNEYCFVGLNAENVAKKYICKAAGESTIWEVSEVSFLSEHQSLSEYRKSAAQDVIDTALSSSIATKQDIISDLATIRSGSALGATAYQKPSTGVPLSDLSSDVSSSLHKADTALQEHQSLSAYRTAANQDLIDATFIKTSDTSEVSVLDIDNTPVSGSTHLVFSGGIYTAVAERELGTNKVTSLTAQSTDNQYPSAKCVYDIVGNVESLLNDLL